MRIEEINDLVKEIRNELNYNDEFIYTIHIAHGGEVFVSEKLFRKLFEKYEREPYTENFDRLIDYMDEVMWYCLVDKKEE